MSSPREDFKVDLSNWRSVLNGSTTRFHEKKYEPQFLCLNVITNYVALLAVARLITVIEELASTNIAFDNEIDSTTGFLNLSRIIPKTNNDMDIVIRSQKKSSYKSGYVAAISISQITNHINLT